MTQGTHDTAAGRPTLWDRTRQLAAQEILDTALRLFTEQGYDETTVAQIAREAGVSQRTLFRYYGTKEDLVGGNQEHFVALLTQTVREQPPGTDIWGALRAAVEATLSLHATPEQARERLQLVHRTASLRAAYLGKRARCQEELLPLLEARAKSSDAGAEQSGAGQSGDVSAGAVQSAATQPGDVPAGAMQTRAIVATAFAVLDAAMATWLENDGRGSILDLYDQGIAAVRT